MGIYDMPVHGIFISQLPYPGGSRQRFFYEQADGDYKQLENTIQKTDPDEEDEANGTTYVYVSGIGLSKGPEVDCGVYLRNHWTGTMEQIRSAYDPLNATNYLVNQGFTCDDLVRRANEATQEGRDPGNRLFEAIGRGELEDVETVIESGVDVTEHTGIGQQTALMYAAGQTEPAIADLLVDGGANVGARDVNERTALMHAALRGNAAMAEFLLEKGAEIDARDAEGQTPLMLAARRNEPAVAEALIERGASLEATDGAGRTPLMLAARDNDAAMVASLVDHGADVAARDDQGVTPLMYAARLGAHEPMIRHDKGTVADALLERGATVDASDHKGWTPLMWAAALDGAALQETLRGADGHYWVSLVETLLAHDAALDAEDHQGRTPLLVAAQFNRPDRLRLLLDKGAEWRVRDDAGRTALMLAARYNTPEMVTALLELGADPTATTPDGETASDLAMPDNPQVFGSDVYDRLRDAELQAE
ncbi:MAG: ankyrin repeat domain-containing protein [Ectothiorhodospiraceae bacterium]